jgi:hypothetical protein
MYFLIMSSLILKAFDEFPSNLKFKTKKVSKNLSATV